MTPTQYNALDSATVTNKELQDAVDSGLAVGKQYANECSAYHIGAGACEACFCTDEAKFLRDMEQYAQAERQKWNDMALSAQTLLDARTFDADQAQARRLQILTDAAAILRGEGREWTADRIEQLCALSPTTPAADECKHVENPYSNRLPSGWEKECINP